MPTLQERKQEEMKMWEAWKTGDNKALPSLLTSMDPLIQQQVSKYSTSGLPRVALETQARKLAYDSFHTYDPSKAGLNTHVVNNMRHMQRFVIEYQNVGKIPEHRGILITKYNNTYRLLENKLGREPSLAELSADLGWSLAETERMQMELRKDLTIVQESGEEDDSSAFFDSKLYETDKLKDYISFVYHSASMEDKKIIEYSFGIGGRQPLKVKEIAKKLNKSESYIRKRRAIIAEQIQAHRKF